MAANDKLNRDLMDECRIEPRKWSSEKWREDNQRAYNNVKSLLSQGADPNATMRTNARPGRIHIYEPYIARSYTERQTKNHNMYPLILAALNDNNGAIRALCEDKRLKLNRLYSDPEEEINDSFQACVVKLNPEGLRLQVNTNQAVATNMMNPWKGQMTDKLENDKGNIEDILQILK